MIQRVIKAVKNILTREQPSILSASFVMMLILLITKAMGLFTKTVSVTYLGADDYGLFVAANTLPETLATILLFGSITSVLIPLLVEEMQQNGRKSFTRLFNSIVSLGLLVYIAIAIFVILKADDITPFVMEEYAKPVEPYSVEELTIISSMMKWLMIPQLILGISVFISSALNAYKRFIIPQLAPLFYNLGVLIGAVFLIPAFDIGARGLVWGSLIGALLHLLVQLPIAIHLDLSFKPQLSLRSKRLREIMIIAFPRIFALAADQIAIAIDKVISFGLGMASVGAYQLAVSLVTIPYSLFSNTFSIASLPHLSSSYARGNMKRFESIFSSVFNQILFLTVPVTMILLVLRLPLVRLFYGIFGNEFTWENTLMVSWVVFFLSLGLIPEILYAFVARTFYALKDTVRPLIIGIYVMIGGIVTGIYFTNYLSHFGAFSLKELYWEPSFFFTKDVGIAAVGGLALSSAVIYTSAFLFLMIFLHFKLKGLSFKFYISILRKLVYGLIIAAFMYFLFKMWDEVLDTAQTLNLFILTVSTITPGVLLYLWLTYIFKEREFSMFIDAITRLRKRINLKKLYTSRE